MYRDSYSYDDADAVDYDDEDYLYDYFNFNYDDLFYNDSEDEQKEETGEFGP